jgi:hypothetical protein
MRSAADPESENERCLIFRPRGSEWIRKIQAMRTTAEVLLNAAGHGSDGQRFVVRGDPVARDDRDLETEGEDD